MGSDQRWLYAVSLHVYTATRPYTAIHDCTAAFTEQTCPGTHNLCAVRCATAQVKRASLSPTLFTSDIHSSSFIHSPSLPTAPTLRSSTSSSTCWAYIWQQTVSSTHLSQSSQAPMPRPLFRRAPCHSVNEGSDFSRTVESVANAF